MAKSVLVPMHVEAKVLSDDLSVPDDGAVMALSGG